MLTKCRSSEEEIFIQKKKMQNRETVYVNFFKFWFVDVSYLITEQLNWSHTQFVCAWIGHVHSVDMRNIKEAIVISN